MISWILDFLFPSRVCERTGECDYLQITVSGYQYPPKWPWRHVADEVTVNIHECRRCNKRKKMEDDDVISRSGLHSLSMPDSYWKRLKRKGFIEC